MNPSHRMLHRSIPSAPGRWRRLPRGWGAVTISLFLIPVAYSQTDPAKPDLFPSPAELKLLSIEDLAELRITTAGRRTERLHNVSSAVSVVTGEDIRRGGVHTLPDALRLATGVHVARANNNTWAIGVRGFNLTTTNKLLVLKDGRSLYSPLFAGVFWDVQETMLEDVERIEVIRGPGATLWGANAVNGVINIITRNAKDTQGALLSGGAGAHERGFVAGRYGGQAGENTWYRVYVKGWDRDDIVAADGSDTDERSRFGQGGVRIDSEPRPDVSWTVQGDLYDGRYDQLTEDPIDLFGGNVLGRWTHSYDADHRVQIQTYYDRVERDIPERFGEVRDTFDAEMNHRFVAGDRHDFLWGANARVSRDDVDNSATLAFFPDSRTVRLFSAFVQDRISLAPDRLDLTLGSKFEHNSYSGFEYQPGIRLAWMPEERQTVWASVSRAVRTPSRIDTDFVRFEETSGDPNLRGNRNFRAERLVAYETGYRVQPAQSLTLDLALFYHDYDHLRSLEEEDPTILDNRLEGETYGGELSGNYRLSQWWRLKGGYAHLQKRLRAKSGSDDDPNQRGAEGNDPRHIVFLQSTLNLGDRWTLDGVARHVSRLPNPRVPSYTELDLRAARFIGKDLEVSVVGRNLLDPDHREFGATHAVPRTVYFRMEWQF